MSNLSNDAINTPGQNNLTGGTEALFLEMFSGEVLNTFDETNIMMPLHRVMRVGPGKSFQFPRIGKADAQYHVRGEDLLLESNNYLNNMEHTAVTINVDKTLLSSCFVDNWDEMIKHYETRSEYAKQLGASLARTTDLQLLRLVAKATRFEAPDTSSSPFEDPVNKAATEGSAVTIEAGETIRQGVIKAAIALARKEVPMADVVVAVSPEDYYALLEDDQLVSADFSSAANADRSTGKIFKAYGFRVVMTPRLKDLGIGAGDYTGVEAGELNDYKGDFSTTRALAWHSDAIGTVMRNSISTETDYRIERQGTLLVAKATMGHGILKNECAVEIKNA